MTACERAEPPPVAPSCDEREAAYRALLIGSGEPATSCERDGDCVAESHASDCARGCFAPLSRRGAADLRARIEQANQGPCKGFKAAGCATPEPSCAPTGKPVCSAGECRFDRGGR